MENPEGVWVQHEISWASFMLMNTARPPSRGEQRNPSPQTLWRVCLALSRTPGVWVHKKLGLEEYQKTEYYIIFIWHALREYS